MDFITLANAAHRSSRAIIRLLTEEDDNDDFAQLENLGPSRHNGPGSSPSDAGSARGGGDVDYYSYEGGGGSDGVPNLGNRPLLSPTAESALLDLCTNFLLYVAMVLITVMVARIYFPTWLEPREDPNAMRSSAHMYMNVIEDASFSDEEDDGEEEEEGFIEAGAGRKEAYKDDVNLLGEDGVEGRATAEGPPPPPAMKLSTMSSFLDNDQETMSRESVYTNLAICAVMLNVTFVSWGLLQVRYPLQHWK
jgi:hypothetical protein